MKRKMNFAPTAATVSVSWRVTTLDDSGLRNARVTLAAADGSEQTVLTGMSGAFRFTQVEAGQTYIVSVHSRQYVFAPRVVLVAEDISDLIFTSSGHIGGGELLSQ